MARAAIAVEAKQLQHPAAQRCRPRAGAEPDLPRFGAAHQPCLRPVRPHPQAEHGKRVEHRPVVVTLGRHQHVGEHLMRQQLAVAVLHRVRARHQARFFGEGGEQPLREGMDRIDPQAAARRVQHLREQGPGMRLRIGIDRRADSLQIGSEVNGIHPHPAGQHRIDPRRHFGGARLGEGEAEDLPRIDTGAQQQAQHPGGQHLRLAGAGRSGKPHAIARIDRQCLVALQGVNCAAAHVSRPIHSSRRISWS